MADINVETDTEVSLLATPYDVWEYYLLDLDPKSLQAACRAHRQFYSICKLKSFWKKKFLRDYPILLDEDEVEDDEYDVKYDGAEGSNWYEASSQDSSGEAESSSDEQKYLNMENFTEEDGDLDYERMWKFFTTFFMKYGKIVNITIPVTLAIFKAKESYKDEYEEEVSKAREKKSIYRDYSRDYFLNSSSIDDINPLNNSSREGILRILNAYNNMTGEKLQHDDICDYFKYALRKMVPEHIFHRSRIHSAERVYTEHSKRRIIEWTEDKYPQSVTNFVKTYKYFYYNDYYTEAGSIKNDSSYFLKPLRCTFNSDTSSIELKAHVIIQSELFKLDNFDLLFKNENFYPDWVNFTHDYLSSDESGDVLLDLAIFDSGGLYLYDIEIYNRGFLYHLMKKRKAQSSSSR